MSCQPPRWAASAIPSSPALASTVASVVTDPWARPPTARASPMRASTSSAATPRLAPTPTASDGGRRTTVCSSTGTMRSVTTIRHRPAPPTVTGKEGIGHVASVSRTTCSPSSRARLTMASAPSVGQPSVSSPGSPVASVAVVMIACAPNTSATRAHRSLAPAACPPTSATAYRAGSSTQTTAGSVHLLSSSGAISRVVAPTARKHTSSSHSAQARCSACLAGAS